MHALSNYSRGTKATTAVPKGKKRPVAPILPRLRAKAKSRRRSGAKAGRGTRWDFSCFLLAWGLVSVHSAHVVLRSASDVSLCLACVQPRSSSFLFAVSSPSGSILLRLNFSSGGGLEGREGRVQAYISLQAHDVDEGVCRR